MKNAKTYLIIFLALGAFVLIMQSRSTTTGKSFLGIGSSTNSNSPWYEKLGAGAGTFFGNLSQSIWGKKSSTSAPVVSASSDDDVEVLSFDPSTNSWA